METPTCDVCGTPYTKTKRHQRYCSKSCYQRAWIKNNRAKHNQRARDRYKNKPEWYREHVPRYYRIHRARLEASKPWAYLLKSAKNRAKEKNIEFSLDDDWASARWTGYCEITGLKFVNIKGERGPNPYSPSIDRKIASIGYTKGNTRFIIFGCNAIKGSGTDEDMLIIAKAILDHPSAISPTVGIAHTTSSSVASIPSTELIE